MMQADQQKVLILRSSEEQFEKDFANLVHSFDASVKEVKTLEDAESELLKVKYQTFILFFGSLSEQQITDFFEDIANEKETTMIIGIGIKPDKYPDMFDFYFSPQNLCDTAAMKNVLSGILRITQKVKDQIDLSSMLIHDMRSPMQSILNYIELIQDGVFGELNEGQKQMISNSMRLIDGILELFHELGDVMRFENKNFLISRSSFSAGDWLHATLQGLWIQADKKNIKMILNISNEDTVLFADRLALNRVMINIITNALQYTPHKGTVKVEGKLIDKGDVKEFDVKVTDSGPGISEKNMPIIFDKYYRIRSDKSTKGYGIGLYISRLFIEAHGGKISAYNEEGNGAVIHFSIPVVPEPVSLETN